MSRLEEMLQGIFKAEGISDWSGLAKRAMVDFRLQERNDRIYEMRAKGATAEEISRAIGVTSRQVQSIVRDQLLIRRSAK